MTTISDRPLPSSTRSLSVCLPPSWRHGSDPGRGVLARARATQVPPSGVPPEVVVRCAPAGGLGPDGWATQVMAGLAAQLRDLDLEDDDAYDLGGRTVAYRRFAHRVRDADVLCDLWCWVVDDLGLSLLCSVARADYWDYCDVFETIAETVELC